MPRKWAIPGTPGFEHRIGGLEKTIKGSVSYTPENHEYMVKIREEKVERVVAEVPDLEITGNKSGDLLVIGWGSTYGHLIQRCDRVAAKRAIRSSSVNFNYIRPLPANTEKVFSRVQKTGCLRTEQRTVCQLPADEISEVHVSSVQQDTGTPIHR
ncbi:MAG: hypothetical protein MZV63_54795 [Marinilabiliales bacterium]|nr:hypothetical protein [Marinilabiliales bacterium]